MNKIEYRDIIRQRLKKGISSNHMEKRTLQNTAVILAAISATLTAIYANTNWLTANSDKTISRERCYGIVRSGQNDCATAKHSCASQATINNAPDEFIMLPKGLCERIKGGLNG